MIYGIIKLGNLSFMVQAILFGTILGGIIIVMLMPMQSYAANSIEIFTLNSEIYPTDDVFVTGFVSTKSFYKPVTLEVYDPSDELLYSPQVNFNDDGQFSWLIHPPLGKFKESGTYTILASNLETNETAKIQFTVIDDETIKDSNPIENIPIKDDTISKITLNSYEFTDTKPEIQNKKPIVKTTNSEITSNKGIVGFLQSDELIYVIPIFVSILIGLVIWTRVTSDKSTYKKESSKI